MAAAPASCYQDDLDRAAESVNDSDAVAIYRAIIAAPPKLGEEKALEHAINALSTLLAKQSDAAGLAKLIVDVRPLFSVMAKAKTARVVRHVLDQLAKIPGSEATQAAVCASSIEWAKAEKRSFLRMRLELRLSGLLLRQHDYAAALALVNSLLREVKRLDDKQLLVEIHLLESHIHHALRNLPKARAALTSGRTAANSIYVGPELQAEIDQQAGTLHADDKDYRTAFSYFFEAFEGLSSLGDAGALHPLKYMIMCKIMMAQTEDVNALISGKGGVKFAGPHMEALRAVSQAYRDRSLLAFERALVEYKQYTVDDPFISRHLHRLADILLESNLIRIIEPFSRVELSHVAALIALPLERVETKLSQMILDKKFAGTLDQGKGHLLVFEKQESDRAYTAALATTTNLGRVVDTLFKRADKL